MLAPFQDVHAYHLPLPDLEPENATSGALVNQMMVGATPGRLIGFSGYSNRASAQFILCFDLSTPPGSGAVPVLVFAVGIGSGATTGNFSAYFGTAGRWFYRGCWLANSSTAATLTAGSADTWFDAQYVPQVV